MRDLTFHSPAIVAGRATASRSLCLVLLREISIKLTVLTRIFGNYLSCYREDSYLLQDTFIANAKVHMVTTYMHAN